MAENLGDAVLDLRTDDRRLNRGLRDARRTTERSTRNMERSWDRVNQSINVIGSTLAAVFAVRRLARFADTAQALENQLRVVTDSTAELADIQERLLGISTRTRTSMSGVVQLYQRTAIAQDELNASQSELLRLTEVVGMALATQGGAASEASGALRQLSQSFSSGIVRAEEFNSILEGAFPLAQAAARGLDRAGGSVGRLRQLVVEGEVSSREFFDAILEGSDDIEEAFKKSEATISQSLTVVGNAFTQLIGRIDDTIGSSKFLATQFELLATAMNRMLSDPTAAGRMQELNGELGALQATLMALESGDRTLLQRLGIEEDDPDVIRARIAEIRREIGRLVGLESGLVGGPGQINIPELRRPDISLLDPRRGLLSEVDVSSGQILDKILPASAIKDHADNVAEDIENRWDRLGETMGQSLTRSLADAMLGIETNWEDMIRRMLVESGLRQMLSALANVGGPVGSIAGFLGFGSGGLPGFQHGGSFTVGGSGPPDSQLVAFRASPRERIDISRAGEGRTPIHVTNNIQTGLPAQVVGELEAIGNRAGAVAAMNVLGESGRPRPSHA